MVAELAFQRQRDRADSTRAREKAEANVERIKRAAERIRAMTELYRERLDGRRTDVAR